MRDRSRWNAYGKKYRDSHKEVLAEKQRAYRREHRKKYLLALKKSDLKRKYGLTPEEYEKIAERQDGKCLICGNADQRLVVDHSHSTNIIRGLLCNNCNAGLGMFRDNPELLKTAALYLEEKRT